MKTIQVRITLKDWRRLRRLVYAREGETCAEYLSRVIEKLEELKNDRT